MNKVTTLRVQKTLNSLRSCMPPSRTCMPIDGVYMRVFGDQSAGLWTKTKYTESDHFIFQRKSAMIVSITISISKVLYLFMSGIAIIALLLLVTSLAKVSRASLSIVHCLSLHWRKQKYCRLWSPVNDVASF